MALGFRFLAIAGFGLLFAHTHGLREFFLTAALGGLLPFLHRSLTLRQKLACTPEFILAVVASWWPLRTGFPLMEGGEILPVTAWLVLIAWAGLRPKAPETFADIGVALTLSLAAAPEQANSLGQGMSVGFQIGGLTLFLCERIFSRMCTGWAFRRSPVVLGWVVFGAHLFLVASRDFPGLYGWLHWKVFLLSGLVFAFLWTSPLLGSEDEEFPFWLALPSAAIVFAPVLIRFSTGDALMGTRHGFALLHPNLLGAGYLLSAVLLDRNRQTLNVPGIRLGLHLVFLFGVIGTQSRLCLALYLLHLSGLFRESRPRFCPSLPATLAGFLGIYLTLLLLGWLPARYDIRRLPGERRAIFSAAIAGIRQSPNGEGFLQFGFRPRPLSSQQQAGLWDWHYPHTHQVYLEGLLTFGILPGLVLFGLLFQRFRRAPPGTLPRRLLGIHGLIGLFDMNLYVPFHITTLLLGVIDSPVPAGSDSPVRIRPPHRWLVLVAGGLLGVTAISSLPNDLAAIAGRKAWTDLSGGDFAGARTLLAEAAHLDEMRVEPHLYRVLLEWQCPAPDVDLIDRCLRQSQRLAPDWDIPHIAYALETWRRQQSSRAFSAPWMQAVDVTGFRLLLGVLLNPTRFPAPETFWPVIVRWRHLGELIAAFPPPLGPDFLQELLSQAQKADPKSPLCLQARSCLQDLGISGFSPEKPIPSSTSSFSFKEASQHVTDTPTRTLELAQSVQAAQDPGNEGIPHLEALLLEIQSRFVLGQFSKARQQAQTLVFLAPDWMDARDWLWRILLTGGNAQEAAHFARESVDLIRGSMKRPVLFRSWEFEHRPVGDNWTILLGKTAISAWLRAHAPEHIPFAMEKRRLLQLWQQRVPGTNEAEN